MLKNNYGNYPVLLLIPSGYRENTTTALMVSFDSVKVLKLKSAPVAQLD
jgi:hypothetical protein